MATPSSFLLDNPTAQSVELGGRYINLTALARAQHIDLSYLSRILSGKRSIEKLSIGWALKLSAALGMSIDELVQAIQERREEILTDMARATVLYQERKSIERRNNTRRVNMGLPPVPSVPGL